METELYSFVDYSSIFKINTGITVQSSVLLLATQTCKSQMETVRCDELHCYQYYSDAQFYVSTSKPNRADSLVTLFLA